MDEFGSNAPQEEYFSKAVRAGKRTYFFDVKATRSNELFLTITESKKRFNQQTGHFFFEKHKLFLYQEDFGKFEQALKEAFEEVEKGQGEITPPAEGGQRRDDFHGESPRKEDTGTTSEEAPEE
ncbi:MAG: DUF3276 family protein [Bacteroidales bacterium]